MNITRAACVGAAVLTTVALLATSAQPRSSGEAAKPPRTYVYSPHGKQIGWVDRTEGSWGASLSANADIYTLGRGYIVQEGNTISYGAWPHPKGQTRRYLFLSDILLEISATRWNVYHNRHLLAYTRGPDGAAAAVAFAAFGDGMWPN